MFDVGFASVDEVEKALLDEQYLPDRALATSVFLAATLQRPLLLEGEAGVGKTELAKVLARIFDTELIRLQCYEGIDVSQALYEWDYARQVLYTRVLQDDTAEAHERIKELYGPEFLIERPLLRAIRSQRPPVLLIDELDRADDEFEGFLLELLSDYTVTVPELGTLRAASTPMVIITSNRTRELHDALRRRCCFQWLEVPGPEREEQIVRLRAPHVPAALARSVALAAARIRTFELMKPPGAAEAIDWANALAVLGADAVTSRAAQETLGWLLKNREDVARVTAGLAEVVVE